MAKKTIFLSSTAYDLPDLRPEVSAFLKQHGFQVLYHESSHFPKKKGMHSHDACLDAVKECDVFILVIDRRWGGDYCGTKYPRRDISITWYEYQIALEENREIHTFVRDKVWNERKTYKVNRANAAFIPAHVDDVRVFDFVDYVVHSQKDNWVEQFTDSVDLKRKLLQRLKPAYRRISVLFYGPVPVGLTASSLEIRLWRKRPGSLYRMRGWTEPRLLEDLEAVLIDDSMGNTYTSQANEPIAGYVSKELNSCRLAEVYVHPVAGYVASCNSYGEYTIIEMDISESEWHGFEDVVSKKPKKEVFLDAKKAENSLLVSEEIKMIKSLIRKARYAAISRHNHLTKEEAEDFIQRLKTFVESKKRWVDPYCFEEEFVICSDMMHLAKWSRRLPANMRNSLFDVLFTFIGDKRKTVAGTIGGHAANAIIAMSGTVETDRLEKVLWLVDKWLHSDDVEEINDAAHGVFALMKFMEKERLNTYVGYLKELLLRYPEPLALGGVIQSYYSLVGEQNVEDRIKERIKGCQGSIIRMQYE